jgi:replicative DNA helicase
MKKTKKTTIHVEASIIGTLFSWPDGFEKASLHLKPEMFKHYGSAYRWMLKQFDEQRSWDIQICAANFGDITDLIVASEPETLMSAIAYLAEEYQVERHLAIYGFAYAAMLDRQNNQYKQYHPSEIWEEVQSQITDNPAPIEDERRRGDKIKEALDSIEDMDNGVPVSIEDWNEKLGGFKGSELTFLGGRPGTGKTRQAISLLLDLAKQGTPTLFVSIEMPERKVYLECVSIMTGIDKYRMMRGGLELHEVRECTQAGIELSKLPFYILDYRQATNKWTMISRVVRRYKRDFGVKVFGLDYIQIIHSGIDKIDNGNILHRLTRVSNDLFMFCNATDLDCIACAQLGRQVEAKPLKRPTSMSDLKEAGAFEQDADKVVNLWRPTSCGVERDEEGREYKKSETEWIIVKNRRFDIIGSFWTGRQPASNQFPVKDQPHAAPLQEAAQADNRNFEGELPF